MTNLYSIPASKLMHRCLSELALQFKATKFVKIVSDLCIPNFPDHNVPTLLVYGEGDLKANLAGAIQFGGMKMTTQGKQWESNMFFFFFDNNDKKVYVPSWLNMVLFLLKKR